MPTSQASLIIPSLHKSLTCLASHSRVYHQRQDCSMLLSILQPFPGALICLNLPASQRPLRQSSHRTTIPRFLCLLTSLLPHQMQSAAPAVTLPSIQTRLSTVSNSWTCKILPTSHQLSLTNAKTQMQTNRLRQKPQILEQPSSVKT